MLSGRATSAAKTWDIEEHGPYVIIGRYEAHRFLTAATSLVSDSFASPNSSVVRGS